MTANPINFGQKNRIYTDFRVLNQKTVLIVDDSEDTLDLHELIVENQGYNVIKTQSGQEALSLLLQNRPWPDMILLDFYLEDMTGIALLDKIEFLYPDFLRKTPVVFVTGMSELPKNNAVGHIQKPYELEYFKKTLNRFLEFNLELPSVQ